MVVAVPVINDFFCQLNRADQFRKPFAGRRKVAPVHFAHEILARHRHVLGISRAKVIVALVGTRAALDAGIHKHLQRPVAPEQFIHLAKRNVLPVLHQFSRKAKG